MKEGTKLDKDKPRMDLLPFDALEEVSKVLTFGAKKYEPDNWRKVLDGLRRYEAALLRHLSAYKQGEIIDPESGMNHLAHVACNALFLVSLYNSQAKEEPIKAIAEAPTEVYDIPPAKFVQQLKEAKESNEYSQHYAYKHAFNDNGSRLVYDSFVISTVNKHKYIGELFLNNISYGRFTYCIKYNKLNVKSLDGVFYKTYDIRG